MSDFCSGLWVREHELLIKKALINKGNILIEMKMNCVSGPEISFVWCFWMHSAWWHVQEEHWTAHIYCLLLPHISLWACLKIRHNLWCVKKEGMCSRAVSIVKQKHSGIKIKTQLMLLVHLWFKKELIFSWLWQMFGYQKYCVCSSTIESFKSNKIKKEQPTTQNNSFNPSYQQSQ